MSSPKVETKVSKSWVALLVLLLAGAVFAGIGESFENTLSVFK